MLGRLILLFSLMAGAAQAETISLNGRSYRADLPQSPSKAPIMILLHGGGGGPDQIIASSRMNELATARGYAVISPAGTGQIRTGVFDCSGRLRVRMQS